jgi:iron complex transport system permease protein
MTRSRWWTMNLLLVLGMGGMALIALNIGPSAASLFNMSAPAADAILWETRLPRILLALLVGSALGSAGVSYQALLRNPLADPYILGVSGGAALGSTLGIALNFPFLGIVLLAFAVSLVIMIVIVTVSGRTQGASTYRLLLTGVVCNAFAFAAIMTLQALLPIERAHEILLLLMGTLSLADSSVLLLLTAIILPGIFFLMRSAHHLDAWGLGDTTSASLGIDPARFQRKIFLLGSVVVAAAVAASGLIGFVGLFIPHAVRLVVGHRHRLVIPVSAAVGGIFLVLADTVARSAFSSGTYFTELPVGVITALIGAPAFLWLMKRQGT